MGKPLKGTGILQRTTYKAHLQYSTLQTTMSIHELSEILQDQLYISSHKISLDSDLLQSKGITHILSILPQAKEAFPDIFTYKLIKHIEDEKDEDNALKISKVLTETNRFIHESLVSGGKLLVHCKAGKSRSVTLVIAYLMVITNYGCNQLISTVKKRRWCAQPNFKFVEVLKEYFGQLESEMQEIGVSEEQAMVARCNVDGWDTGLRIE